MEASSFKDYLKNSYPSPKSRASSAYLKSIEIIDDIFRKNDVFDLNISLIEMNWRTISSTILTSTLQAQSAIILDIFIRPIPKIL